MSQQIVARSSYYGFEKGLIKNISWELWRGSWHSNWPYCYLEYECLFVRDCGHWNGLQTLAIHTMPFCLLLVSDNLRRTNHISCSSLMCLMRKTYQSMDLRKHLSGSVWLETHARCIKPVRFEAMISTGNTVAHQRYCRPSPQWCHRDCGSCWERPKQGTQRISERHRVGMVEFFGRMAFIYWGMNSRTLERSVLVQSVSDEHWISLYQISGV